MNLNNILEKAKKDLEYYQTASKDMINNSKKAISDLPDGENKEVLTKMMQGINKAVASGDIDTLTKEQKNINEYIKNIK